MNLRKARLEVEKLVPAGPDMVTMGKLPMIPKAKKVIEYSLEESRNLNHNYVGTEHILLGLLREENVASIVLTNLGLNLEEVRNRTLGLLGYGEEYKSKLETAISTKGFPEHWKIPREKKSLESYLKDMGFTIARSGDENYENVYDVKNKKVGAIQKVTPPKVIVLYDKTPDFEQIESALSLRETLEYTHYPYSEQPSSEEVAKILSEPISKTLSLVDRLKKKD